MYFIRHIINTLAGRKIVNVRDILVDKCPRCKKEVAVLLYGETLMHKELCVYKPADVIEEIKSTRKGLALKKCRELECTKFKY